jgi:hypothetical protein
MKYWADKQVTVKQISEGDSSSWYKSHPMLPGGTISQGVKAAINSREPERQ